MRITAELFWISHELFIQHCPVLTIKRGKVLSFSKSVTCQTGFAEGGGLLSFAFVVTFKSDGLSEIGADHTLT